MSNKKEEPTMPNPNAQESPTHNNPPNEPAGPAPDPQPDTDSQTGEPPALAELQQTIQDLQQEVAGLKDKWIRSVAELDNVQKRSQKEREEALKFGVTHLARELLTICDHFQRALQNRPQQLDPTTDSFINGLLMIEKELLRTLEKQGIQKIEALGEPFDPNYHQAMVEIETTDHKPGTIAQVLQEGFLIHQRLLRPALVGVAKDPSSSAS